MVRIVIMAAACAIILFPAMPAHAFGIGAYGNYRGGISDYVKRKGSYSYHQQAGGGGVICEPIDSALGNVAMQWRIRVGAERLFSDMYSSGPAYRLDTAQYLYFGSQRKGIIRPSFGPLLGVRYMHGEKTWRSYGVSSFYNLSMVSQFFPTVQDNRRVIDEWGVCLGLSLNFDIVPIEPLVIFISVNAEHYFLFQKITNRARMWIIGAPAPILWNRWKEPTKTDMATEGSVSVGVMFRFGSSRGAAAPGGEENG